MTRVIQLRFAACGILLACSQISLGDSVTTDCPRIVHGPVSTVVRGVPADIFAHIDCPDEEPIARSAIYVKLSIAGKPAPIKMRPAGGTAFEALVPVSMLHGVSRFWYYVEGVSKGGETNQTPWFSVRVIDAANSAGAAAAATEASSAWWANPYVWGAGALVVGGGAVIAANDSGGGGSDGPPPEPVVERPAPRRERDRDDDDDDDDGGFDPDDVVTISAAGTATGGFSTEPQDQVIDGSLIVAGRDVQGIRCTLNFQAYSVPDQFQIIYEGNVLADTGDVSGGGTIQVTSAGNSPQVTIRVITATGGTAWDWAATLEISVH